MPPAPRPQPQPEPQATGIPAGGGGLPTSGPGDPEAWLRTDDPPALKRALNEYVQRRFAGERLGTVMADLRNRYGAALADEITARAGQMDSGGQALPLTGRTGQAGGLSAGLSYTPLAAPGVWTPEVFRSLATMAAGSPDEMRQWIDVYNDPKQGPAEAQQQVADALLNSLSAGQASGAGRLIRVPGGAPGVATGTSAYESVGNEWVQPLIWENTGARDKVTALQRQLERINPGYKGTYVGGTFDRNTQEEYYKALINAASANQSIDEFFSDPTSSARVGGAAGVFVPPPQIKADPNVVTQSIQKAFSEATGMGPSAEQLATFTARFRQAENTAYGADVKARQDAFNARRPYLGTASDPGQSYPVDAGLSKPNPADLTYQGVIRSPDALAFSEDKLGMALRSLIGERKA